MEFTVFTLPSLGHYLQQGILERDACQKAYAEVHGYLGKSTPSVVRQLSAPTGQPESSGQTGQQPNGGEGSVKACVRTYMDENPNLESLSVNQVLMTLKQSGVQAGRTTAVDENCVFLEMTKDEKSSATRYF